MKLINLEIKNFRNIKEANIKINNNINIIYGGNAQGKTSILEAIYLLGITKSFRVNDDRLIVNNNCEFYEIKGTFQSFSKIIFNVRLFFSIKEGKHLFVDSEKLKTFSSFIGKVPVILLSLEDLELTYGSPSFRRKFIDILISQIDPLYLQALKKQIKILKHRNKLLTMIKENEQTPEALIPWNVQLAETASYIAFKRFEIVTQLNPLISDFYKKISEKDEQIIIKYQTFFPQEMLNNIEELKSFYQKKLMELVERDVHYGTTTNGPHRDDLNFFKDGSPIKTFGSQGENKTFLISLKFAEAILIQNTTKERPLLLLDDIFSELDTNRVHNVLETVEQLDHQTFITTTDSERFVSQSAEVALWRVQNGKIQYEA